MLIIDEWGTKTGGIASFNMQLAADLAKLDGCHVYVYVFESKFDDIVPEGVCLVGPLPDGIPHLIGGYKKITTIIGHAHPKLLAKFISVTNHLSLSHCTKWTVLHTCPEHVDASEGKDYEEKEKEKLQSMHHVSCCWSVGPKIWKY